MEIKQTDNTVWHDSLISRELRSKATGGLGATVWLTGLSGSGKSSIAVEFEKLCIENSRPAYLLDGDNLRQGLNGDLGFSEQDRVENIRRVSHVASLFADAGIIAIAPLVSPYRESRNFARTVHKNAEINYLEVYVNTPLEICEERDSKGLYEKARKGEITGMTGIDAPYEAPENPEVTFTPEDGNPKQLAEKLWEILNQRI